MSQIRLLLDKEHPTDDFQDYCLGAFTDSITPEDLMNNLVDHIHGHQILLTPAALFKRFIFETADPEMYEISEAEVVLKECEGLLCSQRINPKVLRTSWLEKVPDFDISHLYIE